MDGLILVITITAIAMNTQWLEGCTYPLYMYQAGQMASTVAAAVSAKMAKLVAGTDQPTMDLDGNPFASGVEQDEAVIEDD